MSNFSLMQIERGSYLKSPHLVVQCIWLNTNVLQGSPANYVGTEPIFVSNVKLYRFKHLIINILHSIQLLQGRLGLWVRAPSGSPEEKPKGDNKKTSPTKSTFCRTFFIAFWLPWPPRKGHWRTKISALSVPPTKFFKKGYELAEIGEMLSGIGDPAFISLWVNKSSFVT